MRIKLPQFPPKPLTPLFPEQEIDIPDLPKPSGVTVGIPPSISVSFDINNGIRKVIPHRRALTLRAAKGLCPFGIPE